MTRQGRFGKGNRRKKEYRPETHFIQPSTPQVIRCPNCETRTMFYAGKGVWVCPRCEYSETR